MLYPAELAALLLLKKFSNVLPASPSVAAVADVSALYVSLVWKLSDGRNINWLLSLILYSTSPLIRWLKLRELSRPVSSYSWSEKYSLCVSASVVFLVVLNE